MYKKMYVFVLAAAMTASYAQAQISIGPRAGFSLTNYDVRWDGKKPDKDERGNLKPGIIIGVTGEYALNEAMAFQSGVIFAMQGTRYKSSERHQFFGTTVTTTVMNVNYLQVPVNALYKVKLGGMKLVLQAGPYFGVALDGKTKSTDDNDGLTNTEETKIEFGNKLGQMKRLDLGVGAGAGLQFGHFRTALGYNFGVANLSNFDKVIQRNTGLTLSLTFLFGK